MAAIGKLPVVCGVAPGYIVPRLQALVMNEAARMVEEGVATAEEIDRATRYGLGLRFAAIGVVEFIDFGGADILHHASREMAGSIDAARYAAPPVIGTDDGGGPPRPEERRRLLRLRRPRRRRVPPRRARPHARAGAGAPACGGRRRRTRCRDGRRSGAATPTSPHGQMHYAACGDDDATTAPVVLLHQTPRSWREYAAVLPLIGARRRAIAIDTAGFGDSDPVPRDAGIEAWAAAALAAARRARRSSAPTSSAITPAA